MLHSKMLSRTNVRLRMFNLLKQSTKQNIKPTSLLVRCLSDGFQKDNRLMDYSSDDEGNDFAAKHRSRLQRHIGRQNLNPNLNSYRQQRDQVNKFTDRHFSPSKAEEWQIKNQSFSESDDWLFKTHKVEATDKIQKNVYQEHPDVKNTTWEELGQFCSKHKIKYSKGKDIPKPVLKFEYANFPEKAMDIVRQEGWKEPTPIQSVAWPIVLSGKDLIGIAQTGSGKTLGFIHPAIVHFLNRQNVDRTKGPVGIVLVPTRELAQQVDEVARKFMTPFGMISVAVYGGAKRDLQLRRIGNGIDFLVATPGRLNDFLSMGVIGLNNCSFLVLDEADRMLDMGFERQIRNIIFSLRRDRQTLMWSATWPSEVRSLAKEFLTDSIQINVGSEELQANQNIKQISKIVPHTGKLDQCLKDVQDIINNDGKLLIFTNLKVMADFLTSKIRAKRIPAASIHSDKSQKERENMLYDFKHGVYNVLIATNVAARGLDIDDITHVINYDCPPTAEQYVHRIGRTARAGKSGISITYFSEGSTEDMQAAKAIIALQKHTKDKDEKLIEFAQGAERWNRNVSSRQTLNNRRFGNMESYNSFRKRGDYLK